MPGSFSVDWGDTFYTIYKSDNVELHGLGTSINCLGLCVASCTTRDAKEIAKLLEMVGGLLIRHREPSRFCAMPSEFRVKNVHVAVDFASKMCYTM